MPLRMIVIAIAFVVMFTPDAASQPSNALDRSEGEWIMKNADQRRELRTRMWVDGDTIYMAEVEGGSKAEVVSFAIDHASVTDSSWSAIGEETDGGMRMIARITWTFTSDCTAKLTAVLDPRSDKRALERMKDKKVLSVDVWCPKD